MRYFVVSDVHSYFDLLMNELQKNGFHKNEHTLIVVGDAFDRGDQPIEMFQFLESLPHVVHIMGNHDAMTRDFIQNPFHDRVEFDCYNNGNNITLQKFAHLNSEEFDELLKLDPVRINQRIITNYPTLYPYLLKLPLYYETEDFIFVHSGFSNEIEDWRTSSFHEFCWNRAFFWDDNTVNKHIYLGHTPANKLRRKANELGISTEINNDPFTYQNKTGIDGGICYPGGQINLIVLED